MKRIFSGIQPTGNVTLGNYLGAIRNWVRLQDEDYECIYCIVDLHAITVWQDPAQAARPDARGHGGAARRRHRPQALHRLQPEPGRRPMPSSPGSSTAWRGIGWLNRMTQFKEKAGKHRENASVGLYAYPNLMAADILVYKATHVPVGEDQKQHLELTRDIAQKFNNDFKVDFFPLPEPLIFGAATRVMSLRDGTKKMSKSDPSDFSRINLTDDADTIAQKIRKAKTDPAPLPGPEALGPDGAHGDGRSRGGAARGVQPARASTRRLTDTTIAEALAQFAGRRVLEVQGGAGRRGGRQARADRPARCGG